MSVVFIQLFSAFLRCLMTSQMVCNSCADLFIRLHGCQLLLWHDDMAWFYMISAELRRGKVFPHIRSLCVGGQAESKLQQSLPRLFGESLCKV